jgi:hypothetical protein
MMPEEYVQEYVQEHESAPFFWRAAGDIIRRERIEEGLDR